MDCIFFMLHFGSPCKPMLWLAQVFTINVDLCDRNTQNKVIYIWFSISQGKHCHNKWHFWQRLYLEARNWILAVLLAQKTLTWTENMAFFGLRALVIAGSTSLIAKIEDNRHSRLLEKCTYTHTHASMSLTTHTHTRYLHKPINDAHQHTHKHTCRQRTTQKWQTNRYVCLSLGQVPRKHT